MKLEDLDIFKLLQLDHLSEEEKTAYANRLLETAFNSIAVEDLPLFLTPEEIEQFNEMSQKEETKAQAIDFLKSKFPDFDNFLKDKLLSIKKDLVKANIEERVDINKQEREEFRKLPENEETLRKILANEKERADLEKLLKAIEAEDWETVNILVSPQNNPQQTTPLEQ